MESSEHVYRFHELIVDANDAYIFFQSHHGDLHSYMKEKKRFIEFELEEERKKILKTNSFLD